MHLTRCLSKRAITQVAICQEVRLVCRKLCKTGVEEFWHSLPYTGLADGRGAREPPPSCTAQPRELREMIDILSGDVREIGGNADPTVRFVLTDPFPANRIKRAQFYDERRNGIL